jgi:hypothetical protein
MIRVQALDGFDQETVESEMLQKIKTIMDEAGLSGIRINMVEGAPLRTKGGKIRFGYKDF